MSCSNSPPKHKTTFIPKTIPHFCHKWQRVSYWEIVILSSLEELASSSSSAKAFREGDGEVAKPPRRACQRAIGLTRVFTWHISSERKSRRVSMPWSCAMMAFKVTPLTAKVEEAGEEGTAEATGSTVSVRGRFSRSWTSLCRTETVLMDLWWWNKESQEWGRRSGEGSAW